MKSVAMVSALVALLMVVVLLRDIALNPTDPAAEVDRPRSLTDGLSP